MIAELVDGLPDVQRVCTYLFYYDQMSVKEITELVGVSENTIKSRLNYARKAIKEGVQDYEKQGVKLYSLSTLPFLLYFLRGAAESSADRAAAEVMVKAVLSAEGAAAAAGTDSRCCNADHFDSSSCGGDCRANTGGNRFLYDGPDHSGDAGRDLCHHKINYQYDFGYMKNQGNGSGSCTFDTLTGEPTGPMFTEEGIAAVQAWIEEQKQTYASGGYEYGDSFFAFCRRSSGALAAATAVPAVSGEEPDTRPFSAFSV